MSRLVFMVLDGVGVGALPDASDYGDAGSDTLGNLSRVVDLRLPFLQRLGMGAIVPICGVPPVAQSLALPGRLATLSAGKDTTIGHWEHMGLTTVRPFPTYPEGFPEEVIRPFEERIGRRVLGNRPASGTVVIAELGEAHMRTGEPIVYTSADSVFQIAAHIEIVPLEQLYEWCRTAREILRDRHAVARVIARPFAGRPGAFVRTKDRRDFSLPPPGPTYLDLLQEAGVPVLALGKIAEVFAGRGVTAEIKVATNDENLDLVRALLRHESERGRFTEGLLFTNLVDFDMVWGHRNDVDGFAAGLHAVDAALPAIVKALQPGDRLVVTADHGVDPTTVSTDHSREYVPLLLYPRPHGCPGGIYQGTLADTGATAYHFLTGSAPSFEGRVIDDCSPSRGWRRSTPMTAGLRSHGAEVPSRMGIQEAEEAASFLHDRFGEAPRAAVVLGSGLADALGMVPAHAVPYAEIPWWRTGSVLGHPYRMVLAEYRGEELVLLEGRVHGYEGFDLSELQLPMETLVGWGAQRVLVTSSCGAIGRGRRPGDVLIGLDVLDCQTPVLCAPARVPASPPECLRVTDEGLAQRVMEAAGAPPWLSIGMHASVPGPQYETEAELQLLAALGATTVSMSVAAEVRALLAAGIEVAVLSLIVNAGHTSHGGVLAGANEAAGSFRAAVESVLRCWGY